MKPRFITLTDNGGTDPILINVAAIAFASVDRRGDVTLHVSHKDVGMLRIKENIQTLQEKIEEATREENK